MTDLAEQFAAIRAMLDALEQSGDTPAVRQALSDVGSALAARWEPPPRQSKKPERGLGYSFDEAQIVASVREHKSLSAAIAAHYPEYSPESLEAVAKRIRARRDDLVRAGESTDF